MEKETKMIGKKVAIVTFAILLVSLIIALHLYTEFLWFESLVLLLLAISISVAYYVFTFRWESFDEFKDKLPRIGYVHISLLLAGIFIFIAAYFYLARFDLLTSPHGAVMGAGYTDVNVRLPAMGLIAMLSLLFASKCLSRL